MLTANFTRIRFFVNDVSCSYKRTFNVMSKKTSNSIRGQWIKLCLYISMFILIKIYPTPKLKVDIVNQPIIRLHSGPQQKYKTYIKLWNKWQEATSDGSVVKCYNWLPYPPPPLSFLPNMLGWFKMVINRRSWNVVIGLNLISERLSLKYIGQSLPLWYLNVASLTLLVKPNIFADINSQEKLLKCNKKKLFHCWAFPSVFV